jgi:hypothetical protein
MSIRPTVGRAPRSSRCSQQPPASSARTARGAPPSASASAGNTVAIRRVTDCDVSSEEGADARQETAVRRVVMVRRGALSGATTDEELALIMHAIVWSEGGRRVLCAAEGRRTGTCTCQPAD